MKPFISVGCFQGPGLDSPCASALKLGPPGAPSVLPGGAGDRAPPAALTAAHCSVVFPAHVD